MRLNFSSNKGGVRFSWYADQFFTYASSHGSVRPTVTSWGTRYGQSGGIISFYGIS